MDAFYLDNILSWRFWCRTEDTLFSMLINDCVICYERLGNSLQGVYMRAMCQLEQPEWISALE